MYVVFARKDRAVRVLVVCVCVCVRPLAYTPAVKVKGRKGNQRVCDVYVLCCVCKRESE